MRKIRAEGCHTFTRQKIFNLFYVGIDALFSSRTVLVKGGDFLKICIISFKLTFTLICECFMHIALNRMVHVTCRMLISF